MQEVNDYYSRQGNFIHFHQSIQTSCFDWNRSLGNGELPTKLLTNNDRSQIYLHLRLQSHVFFNEGWFSQAIVRNILGLCSQEPLLLVRHAYQVCKHLSCDLRSITDLLIFTDANFLTNIFAKLWINTKSHSSTLHKLCASSEKLK